MFADIVLPKNNEEEFLEIASKLNFKDIIFLYDKNNFKKASEKLKKIKTKINIHMAQLAEPNKIKAKADLIVVKSSAKNRFVFEKGKPDIVFDIEAVQKRDSMHYLRSGLDQVICKLAFKNNIMVAFDFGFVLRLNGMQRARIMARMMQNIRFCRKYKVKTIIASFAEIPYEIRSYHDLASFGVCLGLNEKEAKESLKNALDRIKLNQKRKSKEWIGEGVEIIE